MATRRVIGRVPASSLPAGILGAIKGHSTRVGRRSPAIRELLPCLDMSRLFGLSRSGRKRRPHQDSILSGAHLHGCTQQHEANMYTGEARRMDGPLQLWSRGRRFAALVAILIGATAALAAPTDDMALDGLSDNLSDVDEKAMWQDIRRSVNDLETQGLLAKTADAAAANFIFPLKLAPGLPDSAGFRVSAFSDHNPAAGAVLDYNGGTRTYDFHRGTDLALSPWSWNKLDEGSVQVIAAAAGTIAFKSNTDSTDHNPCDGGSNNDPWNYIAIAHSDGRLSIYGHLRYNSLTSKTIGQSVAQGEFLATVGSSGSSSGPHLHFEVRYGGFSNTEWIDPYSGPNSQPESLWASQRPYLDSAINRLSTHFSAPGTADACALTVTRLQDSFSTGQNIFFYAFYRDYQGPLPTQLNLYRPDGTTFESWQYTTGTVFGSNASAAWVRNLPVGSPSGTWRFEATYNGGSHETYFNLNAPTTISVTSPNGGEDWDRSLAQVLGWSDNIGGEVNIDLYRNNVHVSRLASNTPSDGVNAWTPDAALLPGPGYSVRVTSVTTPSLFDASNATFTLSNNVQLFSSSFETDAAAP
jgi:hypothetical protein